MPLTSLVLTELADVEPLDDDDAVLAVLMALLSKPIRMAEMTPMSGMPHQPSLAMVLAAPSLIPKAVIMPALVPSAAISVLSCAALMPASVAPVEALAVMRAESPATCMPVSVAS